MIVKRVRFPSYLLILAAALSVSGCGKKSHVRPPATLTAPGLQEEGIASWYGRPYHGRPTASGEVYDMEKLTAAHRTLPFGTLVRVESLGNHKSIDVRINDRGPFTDNWIIDLSYAAARSLGMIGPGTVKVRIEVLTNPGASGGEYYAVQVGAFQDRNRAERLRQDMEKQYGTARLIEKPGNPILWRVLVGKMASTEAADTLARRIRKENSTQAGAAFVVHLD
jgi:rare lipoprotein A